MSPAPRLWARPELDHLAEVYRLLQNNEGVIAQLTHQMEALLDLLEQGDRLHAAGGRSDGDDSASEPQPGEGAADRSRLP